MRAKTVNFERGKDPRESMDIGLTRTRKENRDPNILQDNMQKAFPEIQHSHTSTARLQAPGKHPIWKNIVISLNNPKDRLSVEERAKKFLDWIRIYTDYDIVEEENSFERKWHPWGDKSKPENYSQQFNFRMRNKEDMM
jgi:hypothetical protein